MAFSGVIAITNVIILREIAILIDLYLQKKKNIRRWNQNGFKLLNAFISVHGGTAHTADDSNRFIALTLCFTTNLIYFQMPPSKLSTNKLNILIDWLLITRKMRMSSLKSDLN